MESFMGKSPNATNKSNQTSSNLDINSLKKKLSFANKNILQIAKKKANYGIK